MSDRTQVCTCDATAPANSERPRSLEAYTIGRRQLFLQVKGKNKPIDPLRPLRYCPGTGGPPFVKVNATVRWTQFMSCIVERVLANPALPIGFPDAPSALRTGCHNHEVGDHCRPSHMAV